MILPIHLIDIKQHLNIEECYTTDDAYILSLLDAAIEAVCRHARIKQGDLEYNPLAIHAIKILIATWYKNREANVVGLSVSPLPHSFDYLIGLFRSYKRTY